MRGDKWNYIKFSAAAKRIFALCFFSSLLFSQAVWPQGFSSIGSDLSALENLIQMKSEKLKMRGCLQSERVGNKPRLQTITFFISNFSFVLRLNEMYAIYTMQSALSAKYEKSSKFWKTFTLIAVPVTAAISGGVVWAGSR